MKGPFVLGTAQLGMHYGIANTSGQPCSETAKELIKTAYDFGIMEFDTAQGYGVSEAVLGNTLKQLNLSRSARIISKAHPKLDHTDKHAMKRGLVESLQRLQQSRLYGYMIHREAYLDLWNDGLEDILVEFLRQEMVERIGISVYSPERARQALHTKAISFIQVPFNLFDHRFKSDGIFDLAENLGKSVYVRSVFLQGLFWLPPDKLPTSVANAKSALENLNQLKEEFEMSLPEIAIGYVRNAVPKAKILFGAETAQQVIDNTICEKTIIHPDVVARIEQEFTGLDENIINPARWNP
jgi:aryl-alcohol dehydrogenase-like predicted oxidoreductase